MKTKKDLLDLLKNGKTASEIQFSLKEAGYPEVNIKSLKTALQRPSAEKCKLKKKKRDYQKLNAFYSSPICLPKPKVSIPANVAVENTVFTEQKSKCSQCTILTDVNISLAKEAENLKYENEKYSQEIKILKPRLIKYNPRRVNQDLKRKNVKITFLMKKQKELLKEINTNKKRSCNEEIKKVKQQQISNASYWRKTKSIRIQKLKEKISKLSSENKKLKSNIYNNKENLEIEDTQEQVIETKRDKKTYDEGIRKCIYFCIQNQVPVDNISNVLQFIVKQMTGMNLSESPSKSCIKRMAREMGVISHLQGAESILSSKNSTVSWDGTSLKGHHLNEVHISTEKENIVLGVSQLAGGKADDYSGDILNTVGDVMGSYAEFHKADKDMNLKKAKESISSTLTDRVVVNHCVVKKLEEDFGKDLHELNCNVHPLDGIANKAKKVLKNREKEEGINGSLFGKDSLAINIVAAVSKLKNKQGTGDPSSFNCFMKMSDIPSTLLPRFVGNRFHVVFKLAGSVYHLTQMLIEYIEKWCPCNSTLPKALLKDLQCNEGQAQLKALGMMGKLLTGPWMQVVYSNMEKVHHLEMSAYFQTVINSLQQVKDNPQMVLTTSKDFFGKELDLDDPVLKSLRKAPEDLSVFLKIVSLLSDGFIEVLERQLHAYIKGRLSNPTEKMIEETKSAPNHNIHAERVLAMADSLARRAPNAKIDYISAKVRFKSNNTMKWLQSKEDSKSVVSYAVGKGREVMLKRKLNDNEIEKMKIKRMKQRYQQKDSRLRRQMQARIKEVLNKQPSIEDIRKIYDQMTDEQVNTCFQFITETEKFQGKEINHLWFDSESGEDDYYIGTITKVLRSGKIDNVKYEMAGLSDDDCTYSLRTDELIADYLLGDLSFI